MEANKKIPLIVAHRGASFDAPENTLAAFRLAWERGADAIECDVRSTADGVVVCSHDADTKRVTGEALEIGSASLSRIQELDAGAWHGEEWRGERIPRLSDVLDTIPAGRKIYIEIKDSLVTVKHVAELAAAAGAGPGEVVIISFEGSIVSAAKEAMPDYGAWLILSQHMKEDGIWHPTAHETADRLRTAGADALDISAKEPVDTEFIETIADAGYDTHVWTVNDADQARRFRDLGVCSITTDRPGVIRAALEA